MLAVNLGEDMDTTGAIYGQIAAAPLTGHGKSQRWRERVAEQSHIVELADRLLEMATFRR